MRGTFVKLLDHTKESQWEGIEFGPILFDEEPPAAALKSCRMQFRRGLRAELGHTLSSEVEEGAGLITIDDAAAWKIIVPEQELPLAAGVWDWDLRTVDVNDVPLIPYYGTIEVFKNVTQPIIAPVVPNE